MKKLTTFAAALTVAAAIGTGTMAASHASRPSAPGAA